MKLPSARAVTLLGAVLAGGLGAWWSSNLEALKFPIPSRSTTILLSRDDSRLYVVNRETNSLSIIRVRSSKAPITDTSDKLAEVVVGQEPRCVALHPKEQQAYVTNAVNGTVSVVDVSKPAAAKVIAEIPVGTEPRGCALSPSGRFLFVANHTAGTVSVIDTNTRTVTNTVTVGGKPAAIAVTNDGDGDDSDETVYVVWFLAAPRGNGETLPSGVTLIEGTDGGKQGIVRRFTIGSLTANTPTTAVTLSPIADVGFKADRRAFCTNLGPTLVPPVVTANNTFCPDPLVLPANTAGVAAIQATPQGAFPNQIGAALIRNNRLYLPNIGAGPAPPVQFTVNVQALVHVVNTSTNTEDTALHVNLNEQIKAETAPATPTTSLTKLFGNDIVAIDADPAGSTFLIVSRGGNYAIRAGLDANNNNKLTINASVATPAVRFQTGNIPNGVVVSRDGKRAYVNNEVNVSVTAINLENNTVITRDIPSGDPPRPGTFNHAVLVGKLAFFTALGVPDTGIFDQQIREIVPLTFRGKQSNGGWSSCGSCHPDGLADGVTWIFADGPRQTIPLDATFTKQTSVDVRIHNWSAVRGSPTDFNNNSRGVQGGCGFASAQFEPPGTLAVPVDPPARCTSTDPATTPATAAANPNIYNHGIIQGASEALDAQNLWIQTVRPPIQPQASAAQLAAGRTVFNTFCASCHGGAKWTKSQILYRDNPAFADATADNVTNRTPLDPGVTAAGDQIRQFQVTVGATIFTLKYLEDVGTFAAADPQEIKANGTAASGALGFNVPSLIGVGFHGPYLHDGSAQTLDGTGGVFARHLLTANSIANTLTAQQQVDLLAFLKSLDGRTDIVRSQGDDFRDAVAVTTN